MAIDSEHVPGIGFSRAVRNSTHPVDLGLLSLIPLAHGWVFSLPLSTRRALVFDYADPTVVTAFTSSFVHLDPGHLFVNLVGYLLVVPVAYLLSSLSGHRRRFFVVFASFVLAFPVVLSSLNWAVLRPAASLGFSGVLLAFVGYLPIALAGYLEEHFDIGSASSLAPVFFFLTFSLISLLSIRSVVAYRMRVVVGTSGLALAAVLMAVLYLLSVVDEQERPWANLRTVAKAPGYFELSIVAVFLFVAFPFAAFPPNPVSAGAILNFYAHLLGYAMGFIATYATICIGERLPGTEPWL